MPSFRPDRSHRLVSTNKLPLRSVEGVPLSTPIHPVARFARLRKSTRRYAELVVLIPSSSWKSGINSERGPLVQLAEIL